MVRSQWLLTSMFLSFLTACVPAKDPNTVADTANSSSPTQGIIGGTDISEKEEIPNSTVGIYDSQIGQLCTGTLIGRNVVLTAAHCANQDASKMYVVFGTNLDVNPVFVQVDKMEISPYFNSSAFAQNDAGDLALLHFAGVMPSGYEVASLLPLDQADQLKNGIAITVAGFGVSNGISLEGPKTLRKAEVTISNTEFGRSEILVDQRSGHGVCHGDSGGPAFINVKGKSYLWGVTSRGIDDETGACSASAAFTSTIFHRTWINRMNRKLSSSLVNFNWRSQSTN